MFVYVGEGTWNNLWYYSELDIENSTKLELTPIVDQFEHESYALASDGSIVYAKTNYKAPNYRIVKVDMNQPSQDNWTDLIPEDELDVIHTAFVVDEDVLVVESLHDVKSKLSLYRLGTGQHLRDIDVPAGTIIEMTGQRQYSEFFYRYQSYLTPGKIYRFDLGNGGLESGEPKV